MNKWESFIFIDHHNVKLFIGFILLVPKVVFLNICYSVS